MVAVRDTKQGTVCMVWYERSIVPPALGCARKRLIPPLFDRFLGGYLGVPQGLDSVSPGSIKRGKEK